MRKINFFFFDFVRNVHIFPQSEINYFEHDHRFLFSREMGNIRSWKEVIRQKRTKFRLLG